MVNSIILTIIACIRSGREVTRNMGILTWIILGFVAGWLASVVMKTNETQGPLMDIVLGVVGALVGGFVMSIFGAQGVSGLNLYSVLVATLGAIIFIWVGRKLKAAA